MNSKFKAGDLVFEVALNRKIRLVRLMANDSKEYPLKSYEDSYDINGFIFTHLGGGMGGIFHATPENRQALVVLCGEDEVPKLPLRGSELTRKLLEKQKYVLCLTSNISEDHARSCDIPKVRAVSGVFGDWFDLSDGGVVGFAVPIDNNGNEIVDTEEVSLTEMSYGLWKKV